MEETLEEEAKRLEADSAISCTLLVGDMWPVLEVKRKNPSYFLERAREARAKRAAEVVPLPVRRPGFRESAGRLVRMLLGREDSSAARRARLDTRAAVERAAKERL